MGASALDGVSCMTDTLAEVQKRFTDEVRYIDDLAQIVLKGHLVMEDLMTESIQTFLLHGDQIEGVRLQFSQKLALLT
jgi:hypothetical protein